MIGRGASVRNGLWEIPVLAISVVWAAGLGALAAAMTPLERPKAAQATTLDWSSGASESANGEYAGTANLLLTPPPEAPLKIRYRATCATDGIEPQTWQRSVPAGTSSLTLPFALQWKEGPHRKNEPAIREDLFTNEFVTLSLIESETYLVGTVSEHTVTLLAASRSGRPHASKALVDFADDHVDIGWRFDDRGGPASRIYSVNYRLAGDGIEKEFFVVDPPGALQGKLELLPGKTASSLIPLRRKKPVTDGPKTIMVHFESPDKDLKLSSSVLELKCPPRPPFQYRLDLSRQALDEGTETDLRVELLSTTLADSETVTIELASPRPADLAFRSGEGDPSETLPVSLSRRQTTRTVRVVAREDKIALEDDLVVEIVARAGREPVGSAKVTIQDKTPLALQLTGADPKGATGKPAELVVTEGGPAHTARLQLADDVLVARPLEVQAELSGPAGTDVAKLFPIQGATLRLVPRQSPERLEGPVVLPAGTSQAELHVTAPANDVDDEPEREAVMNFRLPENVQWRPDSPTSLRIVRREQARLCPGDLLVLVVANEFNTGEGARRKLADDLRALQKIEVPERTLLGGDVFVLDRTGLPRQAKEVLLNPSGLEPFHADPVAEFNALRRAWETIPGNCQGLKATCVVWTSEVESARSTDSEGRPLKEWPQDPSSRLFVFWLGGKDDRGKLLSSRVVENVPDDPASNPAKLLIYKTMDADLSESIGRDLKTFLGLNRR